VAEQLSIDYYIARPHHSWERGSNEDLNGLLRQYFKKSSDFTQITDEQVKAVERKLNQRSRKRYLYENPIFVADKLSLKRSCIYDLNPAYFLYENLIFV
jgi:IS30 family transposase